MKGIMVPPGGVEPPTSDYKSPVLTIKLQRVVVYFLTMYKLYHKWK